MKNRQRRDQGLAYVTDASVLLEQFGSRLLQRSYNRMIPFNVPKSYLLLKLMGMKFGNGTFIDAPFRCDYGKHITVGDHFYANSFCTILDVAEVTIGNNVLLGPHVQIITAGHPIHPDMRKTALEYGVPIRIGDNVQMAPNVAIYTALLSCPACVSDQIPSSAPAQSSPKTFRIM